MLFMTLAWNIAADFW